MAPAYSSAVYAMFAVLKSLNFALIFGCKLNIPFYPE